MSAYDEIAKLTTSVQRLTKLISEIRDQVNALERKLSDVSYRADQAYVHSMPVGAG